MTWLPYGLGNCVAENEWISVGRSGGRFDWKIPEIEGNWEGLNGLRSWVGYKISGSLWESANGRGNGDDCDRTDDRVDPAFVGAYGRS